jgi:hypothetical protein
MRDTRRGQVALPDALLTMFVLVGIIVLAPIFYKFIGMVAASADPFSSLLLQLVVPLLLIALLLSVGVSARRGA